MNIEVYFGSCPANEDAVQLSSEYEYSHKMIQQCREWKELLLKFLDQSEFKDANIKLKVSSQSHDSGTYYEVVGICDDKDENAVEALFWLEANCPENYDASHGETVADFA